MNVGCGVCQIKAIYNWRFTGFQGVKVLDGGYDGFV
jgi:hypothetical protein